VPGGPARTGGYPCREGDDPMSKFIRDLGLTDPIAVDVVDMLMHHYTGWIVRLLGGVDGDPLVEIERARHAMLQHVKNLEFPYTSEHDEVQVKRVVIGVLEHTYDVLYEVHAQPPGDYD
jgi:hypothetical protein